MAPDSLEVRIAGCGEDGAVAAGVSLFEDIGNVVRKAKAAIEADDDVGLHRVVVPVFADGAGDSEGLVGVALGGAKSGFEGAGFLLGAVKATLGELGFGAGEVAGPFESAGEGKMAAGFEG